MIEVWDKGDEDLFKSLFLERRGLLLDDLFLEETNQVRLNELDRVLDSMNKRRTLWNRTKMKRV